MGARRFTSSARSISLDGERFERARGGQTRIRDQDVDLARLLCQAFDIVGHGQIDDQYPCAVIGGKLLQHVAASPCHDQAPATVRNSLRNGLPDTAGGAGQQHGGAGNTHGQS